MCLSVNACKLCNSEKRDSKCAPSQDDSQAIVFSRRTCVLSSSVPNDAIQWKQLSFELVTLRIQDYMENLRELLVEELKDLYSAEKQIVKALPKIVRGATSEGLRGAMTEHLEVTKAQVTRLEEVFGHLEEKPKAKHCKGMEGLLLEGAESLEEEDKSTLRDLQLIGAAQRVEHYEVAAYGTAKAMAEKLGLTEVVELLAETLSEEEEADKKLTEVAEELYDEVETGDEVEGDEEAEGEEEEEAETVPRGPAAKKRR
jgi:ferritin-like metal-binding protein YciE